MGVTKRRTVWRARVIGPDGRERAKHCRTKSEALRWEREQLAARDRGQYVDPSSSTTVAEYARQWAATRPHKAITAQRTQNMIKLHITRQPIGSRRLNAVGPSELQAWVTDRSQVLAPSTVRLLLGHLSAVYTAAVLDRLVAISPVQRIKLPDATQERIIPLTVEQVEALADAMEPRCRAMIVTQGGLGLRVGELLGLRVEDVNFLARTVRIEYQRDRLTQSLVTPKTPRSRRTIPLPQVVADALVAHLATYSRRQMAASSRWRTAGRTSTTTITGASSSLRWSERGYRPGRPATTCVTTSAPSCWPQESRSMPWLSTWATRTPPLS
jgi:integrase